MKELRKTVNSDLKEIRQFIKDADPHLVGSFPADEYADIEFAVYRLLQSDTSAELLANELHEQLYTYSYEELLNIARQMIKWWRETHKF